MARITLVPPPPRSSPATIAELIVAIDGLRFHFDDFALTTSMNLTHWRDELQARLDAVKP